MQTTHWTTGRILAGFVLVALVLTTGCDKRRRFPLAMVKGKVTLDGRPVQSVEVTFFPEPSEEETAIVGPYSTGITDSGGNFALVTRYGEPGAVVGEHLVSFQYEGYDPEMAAAAAAALEEAQLDGDSEGIATAQAELDAARNRPSIPARYNEENTTTRTNVISDQENTLNFALTTATQSEPTGQDERRAD